MGYTLQGIIGPRQLLEAVALDVPRVPLPQDMALIPFDHAVLEAHGLQTLPLVAGAAAPGLERLCAIASAHGRVAYVEADYYGGAGTQAARTWQDGLPYGAPSVGEGSINKALHELGVCVINGVHDAFDALGLGRHRRVEDWRAE